MRASRIYGKTRLPGRGDKTMQRLGMVYFAIVGGAAALETTRDSRRSKRVLEWSRECRCLWKFRVKDFGPLIVGIDAHGNWLLPRREDQAQEKLKEIYAPALTDGLSSNVLRPPARPAKLPGERGGHARDGQGPQYPGDRREFEHRRGRYVEHRQARLGHELRPTTWRRRWRFIGYLQTPVLGGAACSRRSMRGEDRRVQVSWDASLRGSVESGRDDDIPLRVRSR